MSGQDENLPTIEEVETEVLDKLDLDDRSELSLAVREDLRDILRAMIESAKGIYIQKIVKQKDGTEIEHPVYREKPNTEAAQYLLNQLMGKPTETNVSVGVQTVVNIKWKE